MSTFILFWNPAISSYTMEQMQNDLANWTHVKNWSVWRHRDAHKGHRFFMVRCGEGYTGICMSGHFDSEPYRGVDWSGRRRVVYYMDLLVDTVIDPEFLPILTTEELQKQIPSFDWTGGHSGRLLSEKKAEKLEKIWTDFIEQNKRIFGKLSLRNCADAFPAEVELSFMEKMGYDTGAKRMGLRYYEYGMRLLKQYKYDKANAYFHVAYDLLQQHKSAGCYPDLCYRIYRGLPPYSSTDKRIPLLEEALDGFKRQASMGKQVPIKILKDIERSLEFARNEQSENSCDDVVSPKAASKVKGLEKIDEFLGYDYTNKCQFHDAEVYDVTWKRNEVVLRININYECIATFRFIDAVEMKGTFELPYLNEMKFRMYNSFVDCSLDGVGVTITSEEVVCEKVEKYEENKD